jgi:hypothetical protein
MRRMLSAHRRSGYQGSVDSLNGRAQRHAQTSRSICEQQEAEFSRRDKRAWAWGAFILLAAIGAWTIIAAAGWLVFA